MEIERLLLYGDIIAVCSEVRTKRINTLCGQNVEFLGASAKLRKSAVIFIVSVRPSLRMEQRGFLWTHLHEIIFEYYSGGGKKKLSRNNKFQ